MVQHSNIGRRSVLAGAGAAAALTVTGVGVSRSAWAQGKPIKIATLTPLTGAGGSYGPSMAKVAGAVFDEVNAAGGVLGRKIQLVSEDDQTNPEAGVRAARKLIDIDEASAIIGTWASSVTTAVAPLCWESKVFLMTCSGADSITKLPHKGYLVRTQPNTELQGRKFGEFAIEKGVKRLFVMLTQTPFTQSQLDAITLAVTKGGGEVGSLVYDDKKPTYRTEIDQALRFKPDMIVTGGYTPDTIVLLKDLYRAGFAGPRLGFGYAINQKLLEAVPAEVSENIYTLSPSPQEGSAAYDRVAKLLGVTNPDPYSCQVYDMANLAVLAIARAGEASGTALRDNIRKVSQGGGERVDNAVAGLKLLAAGKSVDYDGASGPCDFTDLGDISDCKFRYEQVVAGKLTLVKIA